uniref:Amino acid permease n=1 Tax=Heterorhabditis bacteriophora TaxID=37862 RepID=A0A1I7W9Y3_HETBA
MLVVSLITWLPTPLHRQSSHYLLHPNTLNIKVTHIPLHGGPGLTLVAVFSFIFFYCHSGFEAQEIYIQSVILVFILLLYYYARSLK